MQLPSERESAKNPESKRYRNMRAAFLSERKLLREIVKSRHYFSTIASPLSSLAPPDLMEIVLCRHLLTNFPW
jgi:hypothetical protein